MCPLYLASNIAPPLLKLNLFKIYSRTLKPFQSLHFGNTVPYGALLISKLEMDE